MLPSFALVLCEWPIEKAFGSPHGRVFCRIEAAAEEIDGGHATGNKRLNDGERNDVLFSAEYAIKQAMNWPAALHRARNLRNKEASKLKLRFALGELNKRFCG